MKAEKKEIAVNSALVDLAKIVENGSENSLFDKIIGSAILKCRIAAAKEILSKHIEAEKNLSEDVKGTPYEEVLNELVAQGLLDNVDQKPIFMIQMDADTTYQISLTGSTDDAFSIAADLKAPSIMDKLDPKYVTKVTKTSLNEKTIKEEYKEKVLPPDLAMYCSLSTKDITKLTTKVLKSTEKGEE